MCCFFCGLFGSFIAFDSRVCWYPPEIGVDLLFVELLYRSGSPCYLGLLRTVAIALVYRFECVLAVRHYHQSRVGGMPPGVLSRLGYRRQLCSQHACCRRLFDRFFLDHSQFLASNEYCGVPCQSLHARRVCQTSSPRYSE
jgi:hypothetical protein